jgi:hypothetical protein
MGGFRGREPDPSSVELRSLIREEGDLLFLDIQVEHHELVIRKALDEINRGQLHLENISCLGRKSGGECLEAALLMSA